MRNSRRQSWPHLGPYPACVFEVFDALHLCISITCVSTGLCLKGGCVPPEEYAEEVQGFITQLSVPACLGREKKEGKTSS